MVFLALLSLLEYGRHRLVDVIPGPPLPRTVLDSVLQDLTDSLKDLKPGKPAPTYRIDPNYLNDYRGYRFGLSARQLDCLYAFRNRGGRLGSMSDLVGVAGLTPGQADSLEPLLRFPPAPATVAQALPPTCLNSATAADLAQVRGIGPVLSRRIIRFRNSLGGFMHASQLYDVYGLPAEVAHRAMARFPVLRPPPVYKADLNTASVSELARLPYLDWEMARDIVRYREANGPFIKLSQLQSVQSVPAAKIERIGLYLTL